MHPSAFAVLPQVDPDDVEFKRIGKAREPSASGTDSEDEKKAELVNTAKKENLIVVSQFDPFFTHGDDFLLFEFWKLEPQYFSYTLAVACVMYHILFTNH